MEHDVVVVGGGHAGCEAAHAAWRMGAKVLLVTHRFDGIGEMSCNPAIGGIGKSHLVREVDALDGLMGRVADRAGIHFRVLNRRKGPAVRGPRVQCDRAEYRRAMQQEIRAAEGLKVVEAAVEDLLVAGDQVDGVVLADGMEVRARTTILTTGTFLHGRIFLGTRSWSAGRMGDAACTRLSQRISSLSLPIGRLKTGTPPRLDGRTIDFAALKVQRGDQDPMGLSFLNGDAVRNRSACYLGATTERGHEVIRKNLSKSALYSGRLASTGPRYCPSVEDKVTRFADKAAHPIFFEPEGVRDPTVYPNGLSTSLPEELQEELVRTIAGMESAKIVRPGYAIEYDYVDPRCLRRTLAVESVPGLFLAGQINGTTGYEEAGAQGILAGLNAAACALGRDQVQFDRADGYIGVMVDDLVLRGVSEPYRMFTSRAEYRLSLRCDNADQRLTPKGIEIGCVGEKRRRIFEQKIERLSEARDQLSELRVSAHAAAHFGISARHTARGALDLLTQPGIGPEQVSKLLPPDVEIAHEALQQLKDEAVYACYLERQEEGINALRRAEAEKLPKQLDFTGLPGLSAELQGKLAQARPETMAEASRIEGITPTALALILAASRRYRSSAA